MEHSSNQPGQLPPIGAQLGMSQDPQGTPAREYSAQNPTSNTVLQQAQAGLMDVSHPPYDMAKRFAHIKETYIAETYGVTIE